jgi:hypothetical protein
MNRPVLTVGSLLVCSWCALLVLLTGIEGCTNRGLEPVDLGKKSAETPVKSSAQTMVAKAELPGAGPRVESADEKGGAWGNVKGQITLDATTAPAPVVLVVDKDQNVCLAKGPLTREDLIVNKSNMGIKNAFVWLVPIDPQKPLAIHPDLAKIKDKEVVVDQPCCTFVPHAIGMREGQVLVVKNPASIAHNFHWTGFVKNPGGNTIMPAGGELKIPDLAADRIAVKMSCDIHPWMNGWIRIFDHPYFALTDADGKFEIKNAPAGPCRIAIWQEKKGWVGDYGKVRQIMGKEIAIPPGKTFDLGVVKMEPPKE